MHEAFRRRIEMLEASRANRDCAAAHVIHIVFPGLSVTHCDGPHGFVSRRYDDESIDDFEARADREVLAFRHPQIPPVLVYGPDRDRPMKSIA
jgi:hypothetical protein